MGSILNSVTWQQEVERLHNEARQDGDRWEEQRRKDAEQADSTGAEPLVRMGSLYLSVNRQEGRLLYLLARGAGAKYIVEFGASYGVSTLYLGAAAADNGGKMVTSEVHPDKCKAIAETLHRTGVEETVALLEGDGRETLATLEDGVDFLFLDGWKSQYLPILELLSPKLRDGAMVVADNIDHSAAKEYAEFVKSDQHWFTEVIGKMSVSLYQKIPES